MKIFNNISYIFLLAFVISSCQSRGEKRLYDEVVINPADEMAVEVLPHTAMSSMPQMAGLSRAVSSDTSLKLSWKLPVDWVEREKSGMRLASFSTGNGENLVDCSIVVLGGNAGGLEANVMRWMGQINLALSSDEELNYFIAKSEKFKNADNIQGTLIDFISLQKNVNGQAPSIVAFVFPFEERNIFVKMAGPKAELLKNKTKFRTFCQSLKVNQK